MTITAEITINTTLGPRSYQILKEDPAIETNFLIVRLNPDTNEVAEADSFEEAIQEITNDLFYNEIDI